jgi:hypothetical protein
MYTREFLKLSETMKTDACFAIAQDRLKYSVYMHNVFVKSPEDVKTTVHHAIKGTGTTIEDACNDYLRQARGSYLYHIISELTEFVI